MNARYFVTVSGSVAIACLASGGTAQADKTTVLTHKDGSTTTVNTNSRDTQVIHSTGGGGQYGGSHTHEEVVRQQTRPGDTRSTR